MKKLFLTGTALIAFAAASSAQIIQMGGEANQAFQYQANTQQQSTIQQIQGGGGRNYGNYAITFQGPAGAEAAIIVQNSGPGASAPGNGTVVPPGGGAPDTDPGSQGNRAGITQNVQPGAGPDNSGNLARISQTGGRRGISGGGITDQATSTAPAGDGNFAGILQQGTSNAAGIYENNNSRRNFAEIYQNGNKLGASISQSNNSVNNSANITQGFTGATGQSAPGTVGTAVSNLQASITQGPTSNNDVSNSPNIVGEAVNSRANINQIGGNQFTNAIIDQGASPNGVAGRSDGVVANIFQNSANQTATIRQGVTSGEAIGSQASIVQTVQQNTAAINQAGNSPNGSDLNSSANIVQSAQGGTAFINQGVGGQTDSNTATIYQTNTNNVGGINQGGTASATLQSLSASDVATVLQNGTTSFAGINQNNAAAGQSSGRNNVAGILQDASITASQAVIDQGAGTAAASKAVAIGNLASVYQANGSGNQARISQGKATAQDAVNTTITLLPLSGATPMLGEAAYDSRATINQNGNNQYANIFSSGRYNEAAIAQSGSSQKALILQTNGSQRAQAVINQGINGTPGTSNNDAMIMQFNGSNADGRGGYGNQAIISQLNGSGNIGFIQQGQQQGAGASQSSNDNFASLTQNGSNNTARMIQLGSSNSFNITQMGNNNVLQGEGAVAGTNPQNAALQSGYNNRLTLMQDSTDGTPRTFIYSQSGNNNVQVVIQNSNNP